MVSQEKQSTASLTVMGVLMAVFGLLAIGSPAVAGEMVVQVIGAVVLIVGILQVVAGFRTEGFKQKMPHLMLGVLLFFCGLCLLSEPLLGMAYITLLMAIFFLVEGVMKILAAFSYRPASGWLYMLASGVLAMVLGVLIGNGWPASTGWVIGLFVGVDLMITGISMVALASAVRRSGKMPTRAPHGPSVA